MGIRRWNAPELCLLVRLYCGLLLFIQHSWMGFHILQSGKRGVAMKRNKVMNVRKQPTILEGGPA
jgi:hypothetical protein